MKWQEFYFKWLNDIGYFKWWNATLVGQKNPSPMGSRMNIGTVGFPSDIEGVPSTPVVLHPAQSLINSALENSGPLNAEALRRMRPRGSQVGLSAQLLTYLSGESFADPQKNTLRYWGVQPNGNTFLPNSNFYRGFEYYINAMKQKYELRGPRGNRLLTEKDWLSDKQNRTYPTTRRHTTGKMIAAQHPDYQDYADIGNIMQIDWGVLNGYSHTLYSPTISWDELPLVDITGNATTGETPLIDAAEAWLNERIGNGKDFMIRNKLFDENLYVTDKLAHETLQRMTEILLRELPEISMITAETILQYLNLDFVGLNELGHPTVPEGYTATLEALPLSADAILQLQRLLDLYPSVVGEITFYLNFPYSSDFLVPQNNGIATMDAFGNRLNGEILKYQETAGGLKHYSSSNSPQGTTISTIVNALDCWESYQIVDESLQPFITSFRGMFDAILTRYNAERDTPIASLRRTSDEHLSSVMTQWLFSIPSWVNVEYALAVATYYSPTGDGGGWPNGLYAVPREIVFDLGGDPQYAYEISLSDWWFHYERNAPTTTDLKYWHISTTFLHPSTKKTRGSSTPELTEFHAISMTPDPEYLNPKYNGWVWNDIGVITVENAQPLMNGAISTPEEIPLITYKFWDEGCSWPRQKIDPPNNAPLGYGRQRGQGNIGMLQSFLTPMTTIHDEWWNEFLGDSGILSMETQPNPEDPQNPIKLGNGWEIGWSWSYMENVIWRNRLEGVGWANDITLEDFSQRVYPTTNIDVHFQPKIPPQSGEETSIRQLLATPHDETYPTAAKVKGELFRLPRRNLYEPTDAPDPQGIIMSNLIGLDTETSLRSGYENPNEYVITMPRMNSATENANQLRRGNWTWRKLLRPLQNTAVEGYLRLNNNTMMMEDNNGNLAFTPNNMEYGRNFTDEQWAAIRESGGVIRDNLVWAGGREPLLNRAMGNTENTMEYSDVPRIVIESLPDDIFEMEELTNLEGKTIDYSAPTSSPWRRGKIPLINWAAILNNRILSLITPQEE